MEWRSIVAFAGAAPAALTREEREPLQNKMKVFSFSWDIYMTFSAKWEQEKLIKAREDA